MATLYRRAKHKHAVYSIQNRDHTGLRRTVKDGTGIVANIPCVK